jgi:hypothetical protein
MAIQYLFSGLWAIIAICLRFYVVVTANAKQD